MHVGRRGERPRDRDALALAAREPQREARRARRRAGRPGRAARRCARAVRPRSGTARRAGRRAGCARRSTAGRSSTAGPARPRRCARRAARRRGSASDVHGCPSRVTSPASGVSSARAMRPVVLLPEPDSPTMPRVSPRRSANETSSTAVVVEPSGPRKCLTRPRASSTTSASVGRAVGSSRRASAVSSRRASAVSRPRLGLGEQLHPRRAQRRAPGLLARHRGDQRLGVLLAGFTQQHRRRTLLDDAAVLHHEDVVGELRDDRQVVTDQDDRRTASARLLEQVEHLSLHGHVEGGRGLVGDDHVGVEGERRGDERALPQAARELPRPLPRAELGRGHADRVEQVDDLRPTGASAAPSVQFQGLGDLGADRAQRIERDERILQDEPDLAAPHTAPLARVERPHVAAVQFERVGLDPGAAAGEADDRAGRDRLARAGLADDRHAPTRFEVERDALDDLAHARGGVERHARGSEPTPEGVRPAPGRPPRSPGRVVVR